MTNRSKILVSAFTCCPPGKPGFTGGEDLLGWNILIQIARFHDVWALTNAEDRASVEAGAKESRIHNVHFQYIGLPTWMSPFLKFQGSHQFYYLIWQILAWFTAHRLHKEIQFDLFHHVTYANDWMGSLIGAFLPIPYVRGPGGGSHRTPKGFESEYPISGRIWEKVRSFSQWIFRHEPIFIKGHSRAKTILVCNHEAAQEASKRWPSKTQLFPVSGISSEDVSIKGSHPNDNRFRVITAGSLIRVKGFSLAIRGFAQFALNHPNVDLSIIGSGPERPRLESIVELLGLSSQINFRGELPREQLLDEISYSDVFLFPSLRDGGGTVVIEAMGLGKPVICLDAGGPGMHINEECGVKITPESPLQAIAAIEVALEKMYENPQWRKRLGESAKTRVEENYLWEELGDRLNNIYSKALDRDNPVSTL